MPRMCWGILGGVQVEVSCPEGTRCEEVDGMKERVRSTAGRAVLMGWLAATFGFGCLAEVPETEADEAPSSLQADESSAAERGPAESAVEAPEPEPHAPVEDAGSVMEELPVPRPGAPASFADLVEEVQPSIVNLYTEQVRLVGQRRVIDRWSGHRSVVPEYHRARSLGSGFVIDRDGYILTNAHVIDGATSIRVVFSNRREAEAEIVGMDAQTDIALIRVPPHADLQPLPMGDSDRARVGDWVIAVGNPFGLASTVSAGILSGSGRRDVLRGSRVRYRDFLQTDAPINPGNSGGPLVNMRGEAIGINTAISSEGQGIGFAIPMTMVRPILDQLREHGHVQRSWLGVSIADIDGDLVRQRRLEDTRGALVTGVVRNGPAAQAGVVAGDIIRTFAGAAIEQSSDLPWIAAMAGVGSEVELEIFRGDEALTLAVVLGKSPQ